jgi:hypothetical protein
MLSLDYYAIALVKKSDIFEVLAGLTENAQVLYFVGEEHVLLVGDQEIGAVLDGEDYIQQHFYGVVGTHHALEIEIEWDSGHPRSVTATKFSEFMEAFHDVYGDIKTLTITPQRRDGGVFSLA